MKETRGIYLSRVFCAEVEKINSKIKKNAKKVNFLRKSFAD